MIRKRGSFFLRVRRTVEGRRVETTVPLGSNEHLARAEYRRRQRREEDWRGAPTVKAFTEVWIRDYITPMRTGKGPALARQRLRDYVTPHIGSLLVPEVTEANLMQLRAKIETSRLAPLSVRHILSDVRCLFRFACAARLIDRSPFAGRSLPRVQEEIPDPLSDIELARVLQVCPENFQGLVRLAVWTGLRYSELRGLRWDCITLDGEEPNMLVVRSGHADWTKSRRARRVPLLPEGIRAIERTARSSDWVFTGRRGQMIGSTTAAVNRAIANGPRKDECVPGFHFHRLRHTFASRFIRAGGSMRVLQRILGHASIKTTERYVRLFDAEVSREMRSLPTGWLSGKGPGEQRGNNGGTA